MIDIFLYCMLAIATPITKTHDNGMIDLDNCDIAVAICYHHFDISKDVLRTYAHRLEILDNRELRYYFTDKNSYFQDIRLLKERYQELKNAPPLSDSKRFPIDRDTLNHVLAMNMAITTRLIEYKWLETREKYIDLLTDCINHNYKLYAIYDALRDANCEYYYISVRRQALIKLKKLIGEDNYIDANLPEPFVTIITPSTRQP